MLLLGQAVVAMERDYASNAVVGHQTTVLSIRASSPALIGDFDRKEWLGGDALGCVTKHDTRGIRAVRSNFLVISKRSSLSSIYFSPAA